MIARSAVLAATLAAFALAAVAPAQAQSQPRARSAQIGISPQYFIVDLDAPARTHSYRLHNMGSERVLVGVGLMPFDLDESNQMVALPSDAHTLDHWTVLNPLDLEIPPGESRAVRFSIRPAVKLAAGEHRVAVVFQEKPRPASREGAEGIAMTTLFRIQTAVYATVGPIRRSGVLRDVQLTSDALATRIASEGNGHVRADGRLQVWRRDAFPGASAAASLATDASPPGLVHAGPLSSIPVLPGETRWIRHHVGDAAIPPGDYTVFLSGTLGETKLSEVRPLSVAAR